jgi:hypothetical protein
MRSPRSSLFIRSLATCLLGPLALTSTLLAPSTGHATHLGSYQLSAPRIDMIAQGRNLHAVDGTRVRSLRLAPREKLLWIATADRLAVAVTDDRIIAITTHWKEWQTRDFGVHESRPVVAEAGDDFVLVVTDDRIIAVSDHGGSFVEKQLGAYETIEDVMVGEQVGLILTDRRAIGFSGRLASLIEERVGIHENLFRARTSFDFATVATSKRLLVFDAPTGGWQARKLALR